MKREDQTNVETVAWNKGKAVGKKKAFTPKQIRILKEILKNKGKLRDLALLSLGIDSMLRTSDTLSMLVCDVMDNKNNPKTEIKVKQQKTKKNPTHLVEISKETGATLAAWIKQTKKYEDDYLFSGKNPDRRLTGRMHRTIVKSWAVLLGLDPSLYSTHSVRRTRASHIYKHTNDIAAVSRLLGHESLKSTLTYLDMDKQQALALGREWMI